MDKVFAYEELRDGYVKVPFGFRKARRCAINAVKFRRIFWEKIVEIYPELKNASLRYSARGQTVKRVEEE